MNSETRVRCSSSRLVSSLIPYSSAGPFRDIVVFDFFHNHNPYRAQQPVSYSCRHDSHTPDSARLSGKIPQAPRGAEDFSTKPAGPGLASVRKACGYLCGENRHRLYFSPPSPLSSGGSRCCNSGSFLMRSISSAIICSTSFFI